MSPSSRAYFTRRFRCQRKAPCFIGAAVPIKGDRSHATASFSFPGISGLSPFFMLSVLYTLGNVRMSAPGSGLVYNKTTSECVALTLLIGWLEPHYLLFQRGTADKNDWDSRAILSPPVFDRIVCEDQLHFLLWSKYLSIGFQGVG